MKAYKEKYTDIATILESEIFNIEKNELTKAYREKVNTIKMKLKGSRNHSVRLLLLQNQLTPSSFINNPNLASELPKQTANLNFSNVQPPISNFIKSETHSQSVILPKQSNITSVPKIPVKTTPNINKLPIANASNRPIPVISQKHYETQAQPLHEEKKYPIKQSIQEKNEIKPTQTSVHQTFKQEDDSEEKKFEIDYENENDQMNNEAVLDFENENNQKLDFAGNESPEREEVQQEDEEENAAENNLDFNSVEKKLSEFNKMREQLKNPPEEEEFENQKYPGNEEDPDYEEEENEKQQEVNYFHSQNEGDYYHDERQEEDQLEYNEENNNNNNNIENNINIDENQYAYEDNQNEKIYNNDQENVENEEINMNPEERFDLMVEEIREEIPHQNQNEEKNEDEKLVNQLNEIQNISHKEKIEEIGKEEALSESENIYFIKAVQLEIQLATEKQRNNYLDDEVKALRSLNKKSTETIKNLESSLKSNNSEETRKKHMIKEKENEMLKHELQITQKELKIMKDHLNKMIEENSKFKNEIEEFKKYSDEEKIILRQEIENLHSRINEDLEPSIQKYKNENYLLEQKLNINHQKVELLTKDNQEKDNRIKQLLNLNSEQAHDSSLFSNLTVELQKQTLSLQKLVTEREISRSYYKNKNPDTYYKEKLTSLSKEIDKMANDKFSEGSKTIEKKTHALPEPKLEQKIEARSENKIEVVPEIEKEIAVHSINFDKKEIHQEIPNKKNEGSKELELINVNIALTQSEKSQKLEGQEEEKAIDNFEPTISSVALSSPPPPTPPPPPPPKKTDITQKANIPPNNNFLHPKLHRPANKLAPSENKAPNVFKSFQVVPPPPTTANPPESDAEDFFTKLGQESATLVEKNDAHDIKRSDLFRDESINKSQTEFPNITQTINTQTFEPKLTDSFQYNFEPLNTQSNNTHQHSQSSNLRIRREEIRKNVEIPKSTLTKNNPNMESTTSIHSMQSNLTESEIKRGGGVRKGIIPNSLFD